MSPAALLIVVVDNGPGHEAGGLWRQQQWPERSNTRPRTAIDSFPASPAATPARSPARPDPLADLEDSAHQGPGCNGRQQHRRRDQHFPEAPDSLGMLPIQVVSAGRESRWKAIHQPYLAMIGLARRHTYIRYETNLVVCDGQVTRELAADFRKNLRAA